MTNRREFLAGLIPLATATPLLASTKPEPTTNLLPFVNGEYLDIQWGPAPYERLDLKPGMIPCTENGGFLPRFTIGGVGETAHIVQRQIEHKIQTMCRLLDANISPHSRIDGKLLFVDEDFAIFEDPLIPSSYYGYTEVACGYYYTEDGKDTVTFLSNYPQISNIGVTDGISAVPMEFLGSINMTHIRNTRWDVLARMFEMVEMEGLATAEEVKYAIELAFGRYPQTTQGLKQAMRNQYDPNYSGYGLLRICGRVVLGPTNISSDDYFIRRTVSHGK